VLVTVNFCTDSLIYCISVIEQCCQYSICVGWMDGWMSYATLPDWYCWGRNWNSRSETYKVTIIFHHTSPLTGLELAAGRGSQLCPWFMEWLVMLYAVCQPTAEAPLTVMHYLWFSVYKLSVSYYKCQVCLLRKCNNEHKIWASHCCACEDSVLVGYAAVLSA